MHTSIFSVRTKEFCPPKFGIQTTVQSSLPRTNLLHQPEIVDKSARMYPTYSSLQILVFCEPLIILNRLLIFSESCVDYETPTSTFQLAQDDAARKEKINNLRCSDFVLVIFTLEEPDKTRTFLGQITENRNRAGEYKIKYLLKKLSSGILSCPMDAK